MTPTIPPPTHPRSGADAIRALTEAIFDGDFRDGALVGAGYVEALERAGYMVAPIPIPNPGKVEQREVPTYDAGILNDWGGGNVEWWQDYIRCELGRAHDFYTSLFAKEISIADAGQ